MRSYVDAVNQLMKIFQKLATREHQFLVHIWKRKLEQDNNWPQAIYELQSSLKKYQVS